MSDSRRELISVPQKSAATFGGKEEIHGEEEEEVVNQARFPRENPPPRELRFTTISNKQMPVRRSDLGQCLILNRSIY